MSLAALGFLIGVWSCTYSGGGQTMTYTARFSYDLANGWIAERTALPGGGGDLAYLTRDPKGAGWTYAVFESDHTMTVFRAKDQGADRIVYRTVYPKPGWTDIFEKVSPAKFTLAFTGVVGGKSMTSQDVCTKH